MPENPKELKFYSWKRSKLYTGAAPGPAGRLIGSIPFTLQDTVLHPAVPMPPSQTLPPMTEAVQFHIMGPQDIQGLNPRAVLRTAPRPFTPDAETTKCVHADLSEVDLPWRYTPEPPNGAGLRPWIVIIVGTVDELAVEHGFVVVKDDRVFVEHPLDHSARWAHVQFDGSNWVGRILSPRKLKPQGAHIAAIVPAFLFDEANGQIQDAWEVAGAQVVRKPDALPAYYTWQFWTAEAGDFETLATAIKARDVGNLGAAPLHYRRGAIDVTLKIRGAITSLEGETLNDEERDALAAATTNLDQLNNELVDPRNRPVVGLPAYGKPWTPDPDATTWGKTLNDDPRHRGAAGLGLWMGIEAQEALVQAANEQAGALDTAALRVRHLAAGLLAARSLWTRRLPDEPERRIWLLSPLMRRMPAAVPGGTVMSGITAPGRSLPEAFFSGAARRMLRPGTALVRHSETGFVRCGELLAAANECPPEPDKLLPGLPHADRMAQDTGLPSVEEALNLQPVSENILDIIEGLVGQVIEPNAFAARIHEATVTEGFSCGDYVSMYLQPFAGEVATRELLVAAVRFCLQQQMPWEIRADPPPDLREQGLIPEELREAIAGDTPVRERQVCRPVSLTALDNVVSKALDPHAEQPIALRRVQSTIEGLDISALAPPELPLGLDFPTWTLLNQYAKEWLLPGVGTLEKDTVVAMESNPTFIDAFMVGINAQFINELHWRNIAVDRTSTPLRMFWGHMDFEGDGTRMPDIMPLGDWKADTELGSKAHQVLRAGDETGKRDLIVVFRTDLFRRYPSTLVYLVKAGPDEDADIQATPDFDNKTKFLGPIFQGAVEPDIVFFAFDIDPATLDQYWLILDEPPAELRFRNDTFDNRPTPDDGANFADQAIDRPSRVAISGTHLEWRGLPHG